MADQPSDRTSVALRILSTTPDQCLEFPEVSLASSVADLKARISQELPNHPPVSSMRLIHLGHHCQDPKTIREILGRSYSPEIDSYAIHLVVPNRDVSNLMNQQQQQPRSSSLPPNPSVPRQRTPHEIMNDFLNQSLLMHQQSQFGLPPAQIAQMQQHLMQQQRSQQAHQAHHAHHVQQAHQAHQAHQAQQSQRPQQPLPPTSTEQTRSHSQPSDGSTAPQVPPRGITIINAQAGPFAIPPAILPRPPQFTGPSGSQVPLYLPNPGVPNLPGMDRPFPIPNRHVMPFLTQPNQQNPADSSNLLAMSEEAIARIMASAHSNAMPSSSNSASNASPSQTPGLHLLTHPNNSQNAVIIAPSGQHQSLQLPAELYHRLSQSNLPVENLEREFRRFLMTVWSQTMTSLRSEVSQSPLARNNPNPPTNNNINNADPPRINAQEIPNPAHAVPIAPRAQRPRDPDHNIMAFLVRNIWLFVRIAGILYLVSSGGRELGRALAFGAVLGVFYALQNGVLADIRDERVVQFRRAVERFIGFEQPQPVPARQREAQAGQDQNPAQEAVNNGPLNPDQDRQARQRLAQAELLVNNGIAPDTHWLTALSLRVQQATALFMASLWPGVGEWAVRNQRDRERRLAELQQELAQRVEEQTELENERANLEAERVDLEERLREVQEESRAMNTEAIASGIDTGNPESLHRVNKGKERAPPETENEGQDSNAGEGRA